MADTSVQITQGSGTKLHTFDRSIGGNTVHDEVFLHGMPYYATYVIPIFAVSTATAASHVLQIMAGASLVVYVHQIILYQAASATTAAYLEWVVKRLTTAGTGGGAVTPQPTDTTDTAAGATAMTLPTAKGTEGGNQWGQSSYMIQTPGVATPVWKPVFEYIADGKLYKPIRIAAGATNGIAVKNNTGVAGASITGVATISEANF